MLGAIAVLMPGRGQILHPALWAQLWFLQEDQLDLYVEALSASHAGDETTIELMRDGHERADTDRAARRDEDPDDDP